MQEISIVIPCYNEETRLPVEEFNDFYLKSPSVSFCFVNDGSTDNTGQMLKDLAKNREDRIKIVGLKQNKGKAEAIRQGFAEVLQWKEFNYIGYFDADFSTPLQQLHHLINAFNDMPTAEFVVGSRVKLLGRTIERKIIRHYGGRVFATFASLALDIPVYDTQCGAKLIKADLAARVVEQPFISPWLFDIEIFARILKIYGYQKGQQVMVEVPLTVWIDKGDSRLGLKDLFKAPLELFRIYLRYRTDRS